MRTRDGTIFLVNHEKKVFGVNTRADMENFKPKQQEADQARCRILRMSAAGKSSTQNFLKVQYIIRFKLNLVEIDGKKYRYR